MRLRMQPRSVLASNCALDMMGALLHVAYVVPQGLSPNQKPSSCPLNSEYKTDLRLNDATGTHAFISHSIIDEKREGHWFRKDCTSYWGLHLDSF